MALALFAAALSLLGLLTVGQTLSRRLRASADGDILRSLGMTASQRVAVAALQGAIVGVGAAAVSVAVAVALSPLTPVGLARNAEPDPGVAVDAAVLAGGAAVIVAVVSARAAVTGWLVVREAATARRAPGRPSAAAERAARAGAPATLVSGLALSAVQRGSGASNRSALAGVAVGVGGLAAALTFVAGYDHLTAHPARYGWTVDAVAGSVYNDDPGDLYEMLADAPGVEAFARAGGAPVRADGHDVGLIGAEPVAGLAPGRVVEGRARPRWAK